MNHVHHLDEWLSIAQRLGYQIRYDYFGGTGGGVCQFNGKKWLFIDLALSPQDQLELVANALGNDALLDTIPLTDEMRQLIRGLKAA